MKKGFVLLIIGILLLSTLPMAVFAEDEDGTGDTPTVSDVKNRLRADIKRTVEAKPLVKARTAIVKSNPKMLVRAKNLAVAQEKHPVVAKVANRLQTTKQRTILRYLTKAQLDVCAQMSEADCETYVEGLKLVKVKRTQAFKERHLPENKKKIARVSAAKAKKSFAQNKEQISKNKAIIAKMKERRAVCKGAEDSEECTQIIEEGIEARRNYYTAGVDAIIDVLTSIKSKIEESENMQESDANAMVRNIEVYIGNFEEYKGKIAAAATVDDMKKIAQEVKRFWKATKYKVKRHDYVKMHADQEEKILLAQKRAEKMECVRWAVHDEIGEESGQYGEMKALELTNYKPLVEEASLAHDTGVEYVEEAATIKETDEEAAKTTFMHAKESFKEAQDKLKRANTYFHNFINVAKQTGVDVSRCADEDVVIATDEDIGEEVTEEVVDEEILQDPALQPLITPDFPTPILAFPPEVVDLLPISVAESNPEILCEDGIDNDEDGYYDCFDADCECVLEEGKPVCCLYHDDAEYQYFDEYVAGIGMCEGAGRYNVIDDDTCVLGAEDKYGYVLREEPAGCTETDAGNDPSVYGEVQKGSQGAYDACKFNGEGPWLHSGNTLVEAQCADDEIQFVTHDCLCVNGECVEELQEYPESGCVDTDNGQKRDVYGETRVATEGYYDCCKVDGAGPCLHSGDTLIEGYCDGSSLKQVTIECACVNGKCED